jgi:adenylate cyclase
VSRTIDDIRVDIKHAASRSDLPALQQLLDEVTRLDTIDAEAEGILTRSIINGLRGDMQDAIELAKQATEAFTDLGDRSSVLRSLLVLASTLVDIGEFNDARDNFEVAHDVAVQLGDKESVAFLTGNLGSILIQTGDHPAAIEKLNDALTLYEELGDVPGVARVTGNIGNIHAGNGDYPVALQYLQKAVSLSQDCGDKRTEAIYTGNIGNVFSSAALYDEALHAYARSIALSEEVGDRVGIAYTTLNSGCVNRLLGNYDEAVEQLTRALQWHREQGDLPRVATALSNLCTTLLDRGRTKEARERFMEFDVLALDDPALRIDKNVIKAQILESDLQYDEAHRVLEEALSEAETHSLRAHAAEVHKALRDMSRHRDDFAGYVEHNDAFLELTEKIRGREATLKIAMLEKEREIQEERRARERHQAALYATLPQHVADRVVQGQEVTDHFDDATVLFLDIVNFTSISDHLEPSVVIRLLDSAFHLCDNICERHGLVKIKTVGDSYMALALPEAGSDHISNAAQAAVDMISELSGKHIREIVGNDSLNIDDTLNVRIGINSGPVVTGIIGRNRLQYDVWGDTVNVASRMESTSEPGRIQVSERFASALRTLMGATSTDSESLPTPQWSLESRGEIAVKGKGLMTTYWLRVSV